MREKQLRLLPSAKPLTERFGAHFFRALPKCPGVYLMFDERGRCIYVGQSKNLRQRVNSYRHVHPDRSSRKTIRLVHAVTQIRWEECETQDAAKLRENSLLRQHRPRFNRINTYPKIHCFIGVKFLADRWEFRFTRDEVEEGFRSFGAFKSGCLVGYAALLRLLWAAMRGPLPGLHEYPRQLLAEKAPKQFTFELAEEHRAHLCGVADLLCHFFEGRSPDLIDWLTNRVAALGNLSLFHQNLLTADFAELDSFFRLGPQRNAALQAKHQLTAQLIAQEALDDLLIGWKRPASV